jgi:hypothetical protein
MSVKEQDQRTLLFLSNRWVNSIYSDYGRVQRNIFLQIIEQLQPLIKQVKNGVKVQNLQALQQPYYEMAIDMSLISGYNNYRYVRKQILEMCRKPIYFFSEPAYNYHKPVYEQGVLIHQAAPGKGNKRRYMYIRIRQHTAQLLCQVDRSKKDLTKPAHWTSFDTETIRYSNTKYMMQMYMMVASWATEGGFEMTLENFRTWMGITDSYAGFDNINKFILKPCKAQMDIGGKFSFNYDTIKSGKTVTTIKFKVWSKKKYDYNHPWMKIMRALDHELPKFANFNDDQREQLNYLLSDYKDDLDKVYRKFTSVHRSLINQLNTGQRFTSFFRYLLISLHKDFPPLRAGPPR